MQQNSKKIKTPDIIHPQTGEKWVYSEVVKDHFFKPRNFLLDEPKEEEFDAVGEVGSLACGDVMKMWIKVDRDQDKIIDLKWKTFGCGSAIAATSMFSVMVTENSGMKIDKALQITPKDIMERLLGLPTRKIHCSVLAHQAFRKAIDNYFQSTRQNDRVTNN